MPSVNVRNILIVQVLYIAHEEVVRNFTATRNLPDAFLDDLEFSGDKITDVGHLLLHCKMLLALIREEFPEYVVAEKTTKHIIEGIIFLVQSDQKYVFNATEKKYLISLLYLIDQFRDINLVEDHIYRTALEGLCDIEVRSERVFGKENYLDVLKREIQGR